MKDTTAFFTSALAESDPEIFGAMTKELGRQRDEIELIASENIVSSAVMEAQGSVMTNKYAEGYAGRRYYGGCQYVDIAETLRLNAHANCSTVDLQTCNQTLVHRRTKVFSKRFCNLVIQSLACHWMQVVT